MSFASPLITSSRSLFYLILFVVVPTERLTWRSRAEKCRIFCYFFALSPFRKSCQSPFPSVILDTPSGAELRFNCEICIVTQQINSPVSHRPFTAEGRFRYKSLTSRSQLHQHFLPLRKVIRGGKNPAACRVRVWL